jgi:hypothetical protein
VEWALLKRALRTKIGGVGAGMGPLMRMFGAALAGAGAGTAMRMLLPDGIHIFLRGVLILGVFGIVYLGVAAALGLSQAGALFRRIKGKFGRR